MNSEYNRDVSWEYIETSERTEWRDSAEKDEVGI